MNGFAFRTGTTFELSGSTHRIERLGPDEQVVLERLHDGQIVMSSRPALLDAYRALQIQVCEESKATRPQTHYGRTLAELPKIAPCEPCQVCGKKHFSMCHKCPHAEEIGTKYKVYETSPCASCKKPSDHLKNGHGKVFTFDENAFANEYKPPTPIESDANYIVILDILRAFSSLTPEEFAVFIAVNYFSKTYVSTGKELSALFKKRMDKNAVVKYLNSANEKLSEIITAGKIIHGKIAGQ